MPTSDLPPVDRRPGMPAVPNSAVVRSIEAATAKAKAAMTKRVAEACAKADAALDAVEEAQDARITRSRCGVPGETTKRARDRLSPEARKAALAILREGMEEDRRAGFLVPKAEPGTTELP